MYHGDFPLSYAAGQSHLQLAPHDLVETAKKLNRRQWIAGALVMTAGVGVSFVIGRRLGTPRPASPPDPVGSHPAAPQRGTVEWALSMLLEDADTMLSEAGDLERVSMRYRSDGSLVPCFQRLLDLSLERTGPHVDTAGACAVRSLGRLDREDLLRAATPRIEARDDRPETAAALAQTLEQLRRRR